MAELIEVPLIGTYPKVPATPYEMNRRYSAIIENLNRLNTGKQESGSFLTTAAAAAAYLTLSAAGTTYAPLASPEFSGAPKVPTATPGTNTTQAASTAFTAAAISAVLASRPGHTYSANDWAWLDKQEGLIIQWGVTAAIPIDTISSFTFPISFQKEAFLISGSGVASIIAGGTGQSGFNFPSLSKAAFSVANDSAVNSVRWFAIGN